MPPKHYDDTARMGLRGVVRIASEINSTFWPMRSFVHHNPLHALEYLDFEAAVRLGREKIGGSGYLPNPLYRNYFKSGRILREDLDAALKPLAKGKGIVVPGHTLQHFEVLRTQLLGALSPPRAASPDILLRQAKNAEVLEKLAHKLHGIIRSTSLSEQISAACKADIESLAHHQTLSKWCDKSFGTEISNEINREMTHWCGAFLDEGQAPWEMPDRKAGFYAAWKQVTELSGRSLRTLDLRNKISALPEQPEDAVLESLDLMGIPESLREDYLALHLAALPGWTAFANWRARRAEYPWQQACPIDLVQILAVRLFYERVWVQETCLQEIGTETAYRAITTYIKNSSTEYFFRKGRNSVAPSEGLFPAWLLEEIDLLRYARSASRARGWEQLALRYEKETKAERGHLARLSAAWRLSALASALKVAPQALSACPAETLLTLLRWLEDFPESKHGPVWLSAFEAGYQRSFLKKLNTDPERVPEQAAARPLAQAVFCIDVRSEPFRRQLEQIGCYETYGFAGFFAAFIRYRAFGSHHETDLFPVVMDAKNLIHEIPRISEEKHVLRHLAGTKLLHAGHTLFHDLKENVITPYVMVESIGWFFAFPFFGKTFWPVSYARWVERLLKHFAPPIATTLTLDKLSRAEVEEIIASEQCVTIRQALRLWLERPVDDVPHVRIEALRHWALNHRETQAPESKKRHQEALALFSSESDAAAFVAQLRSRYRITPGWASARMEQVTRTGYTLKEQAFTVETALRVMGLTRNFAPFVLLCAHGSSNENNPFEAALDCGACGGNPGGPNARIFAAMANKREVRKLLAQKGIVIPEDTWFLAAQHDTTTDEVTLLDLADLPSSRQAAVSRLKADLKKAAALNNLERCRSLPDLDPPDAPEAALKNVQKRSRAWNQVRPEWGLSGNAAFIIGHRRLTEGVDLGGRVFLHSYDTNADPEGNKLEIIMTGPQVVCQWINMEHYFSMTDNELYGSGNKIYHNVSGRIGIMSGPSGDLRTGLPWQTVTKAGRPYHEPMRLLVLIEAPRVRIDPIIARHQVLQRYYHKRWVNLVALEAGRFYQYLPSRKWRTLERG